MLAEVYRRQSYRGRRERALAAIKKVGLRDRADFFPTKLSGGERQRVAIARALVGSPSLLLCDEPTGNLDSKSTADVLGLLELLNRQGLALVIVTHNEDVAKRASRRVHILDGSLTEVTTRENSTTRVPQGHSPSRWASLSTPSLKMAQASGDERARAYVQRPPREHTRAMSRSGITTRDLFDEAIAGMFARPGRMMLTVLGIVVGITALVATLGLTRTANNRIISQFDRLAATEIVVTPRPGPTGVDRQVIPWDAPMRLRRLNGVVSAGTLSDINIGDALVSSSPVQDPLSQTAFKLAVKAASPDLFTTVGADLESGRFPDSGIRTGRTGSLFWVQSPHAGSVSLAFNSFRLLRSAIRSTW